MKAETKDFKAKAVQGLYSFDHFEHASGAFIQRWHGTPTYYVLQDTRGDRYEFATLDKLRAHLAENGV